MLRLALSLPACLALACLLPGVCPAQSKILRHPSYSKGRVAFSYLGDIWIARENGGDIQRLTDNKARDIYPRFSPDGNTIAFSSDRDGNYDVFVIPVTGGKPKQLTFHSADDTVAGWTPDGKNVIFSSVRGNGAFPTIATLFEVSVDGGSEKPLPTDWGAGASYSPDGAKLAFMRHPGIWSRKHYRGSFAADIWVEDVRAKTFNKLGDADFKGNCLWPMYAANGEVYFVADRTASEKSIKFGGPEVMKSIDNIWKVSDKGGAPVQVTHHSDGNLYFPSISEDRKTIVYEDNFGLWKLDVASGKSTEIRIDVKSDSKENDTEWVTIANEAESFHLSPSGRRAAVVVHGEVFTIATDRGESQRVTDTPWREQDVRWSPNGKWIAYISDRTGREEVWISDELGKNARKLSDADCDKMGLQWSPDARSLLWSGSDHKLRKVDVDGGKTDIIASADIGNVMGAQFSPDGKWISFLKDDKLLRSRVWVKNLDTGDERMVTSDQFQTANSAKWTPDGKKLLVIGGSGMVSMASMTFRGAPTQVYSIPLTRVDKAPEDRGVDTEEQAMEEGPQMGGMGMPGGMPVGMQGGMGMRGPRGGGPPVVKIEWDGMERRVKKLTNAPGPVLAVVPAPDSRTYAFLMAGGQQSSGDDAQGGPPPGPALYVIHEDGSGIERINTTVQGGPMRGGGGPGGGGGGPGSGGGSDPQWSRDGRIFMLINRAIYAMQVPMMGDGSGASATRGVRVAASAMPTGAQASPSGASAGPRPINFAVRMQIDRPAERRQIFEEAWRTMKDRFYDPKMHGVDWAAAKDRYESVLDHVGDNEELHNLIMEMIGELNASHTGISGGGGLPGEMPSGPPVRTLNPGFSLEADASGYYKVEEVYHKGPADHEYVKIAPGNFVLAVNGQELKTSDNYWRRLNVLPGRKLEFLVNSKPSTDDAWTVAVSPLRFPDQATLEYNLWVEKRKAMVEKLSHGEIGYMHIRQMDVAGLQKFQEELADNRDKKALILDERFNGGGGIDQELLEILNQRKPYEATRVRDSATLPRPSQAFFGPMVLLQNERSSSDAEMFPEGFKHLGLGKVVGVPTMGFVIGTGASTLLDGSQLRTPASAAFTASGEDMENYGVQPDIWVDNGPADFLSGHDRQLEKAVEVLRGQITAQ